MWVYASLNLVRIIQEACEMELLELFSTLPNARDKIQNILSILCFTYVTLMILTRLTNIYSYESF